MRKTTSYLQGEAIHENKSRSLNSVNRYPTIVSISDSDGGIFKFCFKNYESYPTKWIFEKMKHSQCSYVKDKKTIEDAMIIKKSYSMLKIPLASRSSIEIAMEFPLGLDVINESCKIFNILLVMKYKIATQTKTLVWIYMHIAIVRAIFWITSHVLDVVKYVISWLIIYITISIQL